jgi:DNA-binding response OmpR family regulator
VKELLLKVGETDNGAHPEHVTFVAGSHQDAVDYASIFAAGAEDFITVPCDPSVLLSRISMHLKNMDTSTRSRTKTGPNQVAVWEIGRLYQIGPVTGVLPSALSSTNSAADESANDLRLSPPKASRLRPVHRHVVSLRDGANDGWAAEMQV